MATGKDGQNKSRCASKGRTPTGKTVVSPVSGKYSMINLLGSSNERDIIIDNSTNKCLIDSESMVSTMGEKCYGCNYPQHTFNTIG